MSVASRPISYSHRPYQGEHDLHAMIGLVATRSPLQITAYPGIVDLQEVTGTRHGRESIHIWEDAAGKLVGFALVEGTDIAFEVSNQVPFEDLAAQIIAWRLNEPSFIVENPSSAGAVETGCREEDTRRREFLEQQGFTAQPVRTIHFLRSLHEPVPTPQLPEGFVIRPVIGEEEAQALVALHHAAHGTSSLTVEFRISMMQTPDYQRELDLVAVSPEGRLAANVLCHFSPEEIRLCGKRIGYTDPLVTHPDDQRKGLARALLFTGFSRLKARGIEFCQVSTWGENDGMIKTAESAGYHRCSSTIFFKRSCLRVNDG